MVMWRFIALSALAGCSVNLIEPIGIVGASDSTDSSGNAPTDTDDVAGTDTETEWQPDSDSLPLDTNADTETDTFTGDAVFGLLGYAAVSALGQDGTTGGDGDPDPLEVMNGAQMQEAIDAKGPEPLTIHVRGRLTHTLGRVVISGRANISIIGVSPDAELDGFGISVTNGRNVIIRNLRIHHVRTADQDGIRIADGSHHIWIDHCEIYNDYPSVDEITPYDSLLDISKGSDYITVSWSHIRDHVKAMYMGSSDEDESFDGGKLRITFHHNRFTNVQVTTLSVRFGSVHAFNNIFEHLPQATADRGVGISSRMKACVRVENNMFINIARPIITDGSGNTLDTLGAVQLIGNDFGNPSLAVVETPTCTLVPPYEYLHALNSPHILNELFADAIGPGAR